ncbi:MAG: PIN domain-containing protein [Nanoarchaeota archaeon]
MNYCADTWFLLMLFAKDPQAISLIKETKEGKATIIIPIIVFAETTKKLMQKGVSLLIIDEFFAAVEASEKIEFAFLDKAIAQEAARVSLSFQVPLIDSLVAATARLSGCQILLSADSDYASLVKRKYVKVQSW